MRRGDPHQRSNTCSRSSTSASSSSARRRCSAGDLARSIRATRASNFRATRNRGWIPRDGRRPTRAGSLALRSRAGPSRPSRTRSPARDRRSPGGSPRRAPWGVRRRQVRDNSRNLISLGHRRLPLRRAYECRSESTSFWSRSASGFSLEPRDVGLERLEPQARGLPCLRLRGVIQVLSVLPGGGERRRHGSGGPRAVSLRQAARGRRREQGGDQAAPSEKGRGVHDPRETRDRPVL